MKFFKRCSAVIVTALIVNGCSQTKTAETSNINYLWTLQSAQGESALTAQSHPAPDQPLTLHMAADSKPAKVVVATFQDKTLSLSPPPVVIPIGANAESAVEWKVPTDKGKIFTAIIPADGESSGEMEQLLAECVKQGNGTGPAAQRLYDRLSEWAGEDRAGSKSAGAEVVELGAALSTSLMSPEAPQKERLDDARGGASPDPAPQTSGARTESSPVIAFDWRKSSKQAAFGADVHPVVIYDFDRTP